MTVTSLLLFKSEITLLATAKLRKLFHPSKILTKRCPLIKGGYARIFSLEHILTGDRYVNRIPLKEQAGFFHQINGHPGLATQVFFESQPDSSLANYDIYRQREADLLCFTIYGSTPNPKLAGVDRNRDFYNKMQGLNLLNQPLPLHFMLDITSQIIQTVRFLHDQNITHNDLAPENFVLDLSATFAKTSLIDFDSTSTASKYQMKQFLDPTRRQIEADNPGVYLLVGKEEWLSPEQKNSKNPKQGGKQSEVYIIGHMLNRIVDCYKRNVNASLNEIRQIIKFQDLLSSMTQLDPRIRPTLSTALLHPVFPKGFHERVYKQATSLSDDSWASPEYPGDTTPLMPESLGRTVRLLDKHQPNHTLFGLNRLVQTHFNTQPNFTYPCVLPSTEECYIRCSDALTEAREKNNCNENTDNTLSKIQQGIDLMLANAMKEQQCQTGLKQCVQSITPPSPSFSETILANFKSWWQSTSPFQVNGHSSPIKPSSFSTNQAAIQQKINIGEEGTEKQTQILSKIGK